MAETENDIQYTKPTTTLDLEARLAAEAESDEDRKARTDEQFVASSSPAFVIEGNEETDAFVGIDPIYANYGDVSHQPFSAEEGAEAEFEKRVREGLDAIVENSKQASGGATTFGPAVEVDPIGRTESIVRGGTGDAAADRKAVEASQKSAESSKADAPAPKPRASEGGGKAKE